MLVFVNKLEYCLSNDTISKNVISLAVSKSSYERKVQVSCGVIFSKTKVICTKRKKKRNYIKALVLHRACGISFASCKKKLLILLLSHTIYLTLCNKCATRLRISWSIFSPSVQTQHGVFLFWHIWLEKLWKKFPQRAGQSRMASFHVYDLPHEILISCKVGETNNLRQLIRDIRGEKRRIWRSN